MDQLLLLGDLLFHYGCRPSLDGTAYKVGLHNDCMEKLDDKHYLLPTNLRSRLAKPVGELVEGTVEETLPVLMAKLVPHDYMLVAVGDVTAIVFVENNFNPEIIITDGQTKREKLDEWRDWDGYEVLEAQCPAAEITTEAWKTLQDAISLTSVGKKVHVKISGEEDLLVLPLLVELPIGSVIVYGQPDKGAVIRKVTSEAREDAIAILMEMDTK